jgi:DNA anti-recombination protein RmuC
MITSKDEPRGPVSDLNESSGGAHLDKVREILFGGQMREVERRFARLEERLLKETQELKEDVKRRLDALETYARKESESLADQLRSERSERLESTKTLERRDSQIDEQQAKGQRELRQQILEQHQRLSDDIRQKVDEVLASLARETGELRADKADRTAIAALLTEMALRLTNELRLPGAEDAGHG